MFAFDDRIPFYLCFTTKSPDGLVAFTPSAQSPQYAADIRGFEYGERSNEKRGPAARLLVRRRVKLTTKGDPANANEQKLDEIIGNGEFQYAGGDDCRMTWFGYITLDKKVKTGSFRTSSLSVRVSFPRQLQARISLLIHYLLRIMSN